jgi:hypothetical protein
VTKQTGLGDNLYLAGYDLSGDIGSLSRIGGGPNPLPSTGIDKMAQERLGGIRDGGIEFTAWFNKATAQEHLRLSPLPTTDQIVTYCRGTLIGNPAASCVAKQINYDPDRGTDGSLTFGVQALANGYGLEWGNQLTAGKRTDTGATAGTAVDGVAGASFGLQAYLHVFAFSGTDVTIKLQESSDNAGDAYADVTGGGFTVVSGITSQRIATATNLAVERYLKVTTTTSAGFTSVTFSVMVVRNAAAPTF